MTNSLKPSWQEVPSGHWQHARELRHESTRAERTLWMRLRKEKLGVKFRRQHPVGPFFVDFFAADRGLVIELDGDIHDDPKVRERDSIREEYLRLSGLRVKRFSNADVRFHIDQVLEDIRRAIDPPAVPPHAGGAVDDK